MSHDPMIDAYLAELIGEATGHAPLAVLEQAPAPAPAPAAPEVPAAPAAETAAPDAAAPQAPGAADTGYWNRALLEELENDPLFAAAAPAPAEGSAGEAGAQPPLDTGIVSQPEVWTRVLLEELDQDPQFASVLEEAEQEATGPVTAPSDPGQPPAASDAGGTGDALASRPEVWTEALLAELDADPLFAAAAAAAPDADAAPAPAPATPAAVPSLADELIREMENDPHFTAAAAPSTAAPAAPAAPAALPPPAAAPAAPARGVAPVVPEWAVRAGLSPVAPEPAAPAANTVLSRWLRLRCGEQPYALELLKVQEVGLPAPVLCLRGAPAHMLGIMNLRGQVVPVMDLGVFLGARPAQEDDPATRIVVLENDGQTLGLRVSSVEDVVSLAPGDIEPPDTVRLCRFSNHLFRGVARLGGTPMILLDADALLG